MRRFARRIGAFALLPLFSFATPLLLMPLLARTLDEFGWAQLAIGQSVGGVGAIVVNLGWNLSGPPEIATSAKARRATYLASLRQKLFALVLVIPVTCLVATIAAPGAGIGYEVPVAVATSLLGLSGNWFFIGEGRARSIALLDVIPRVSSVALSLALVGLTGVALWFPALGAAASLLTFGMQTASVLRRYPRTDARVERRSVNWKSVATELLGGAYSTAAIALSSASMSVADVAAYSSAERLYRVGALSLGGATGGLVGWVAGIDESPRRRRVAFYFGLTVGLLGMFLMGLAGPFASEVLFTEAYAIGQDVSWFMGMAFFFLSVNSVCGRVLLAPAGHYGVILGSTVAGAVVGVPLLLLLPAFAGAAGVAISVAASQAAVVLAQIPAVVSTLRRRR